MGLRRHIAYGRYLFRHKWFVMVECFRRGLVWRGLIHDLSKFLPSEWIPYARYFYAPNGKSWQDQKRDSTGYYKPTNTGDARFDFAWLLHQKRNRHHWQWWILPEDSGGIKVLQMHDVYIREMVCDWIGASLAQGHGRDVQAWYHEHAEQMNLNPVTRILVEELLHLEYIREEKRRIRAANAPTGLLVVAFGRWSGAAGRWFCRRRIYTKNGRWTPFARMTWRYKR